MSSPALANVLNLYVAGRRFVVSVDFIQPVIELQKPVKIMLEAESLPVVSNLKSRRKLVGTSSFCQGL